MRWWHRFKERLAMQMIFKLVDKLWNLRFLTGHRTHVAQWGLGALTAYQGVATSPDLIKAGWDLPDIPAAWFIALCAYFAGKVAQFAREHQT